MEIQMIETKSDRIISRNFNKLNPWDLNQYRQDGGFAGLQKAITMGPAAVVSEITAAGLRDRGWSGRLIGGRWNLIRELPSPDQYYVCNAVDDAPDIEILSLLMKKDPYGVIEGLLIGAYAIGANQGMITIPKGDANLANGLRGALAELSAQGLLGDSILGSSFHFHLEILEREKNFACYEESALMRTLNGKTAIVDALHHNEINHCKGRPAIADSAETLANITVILQNGAPWYSQLGMKGNRGTKLVQVSGKVNREGIVEVPWGTPLREIIQDCCGGVPAEEEIKFVLVGGAAGGCLPVDVLDTGLDYEALSKAGACLGDGSIAVYTQGACVVDTVSRCIRYLDKALCGKCVICREGLFQVKEIVSDSTNGKSKPDDWELLEELAVALKEGSLCDLGRAALNPLSTSLKYFQEEFKGHLKRKRCPALVCQKYVTYHILPERCNGCTQCVDSCPEQAIDGETDMIGVIDQSACTRCGLCFDLCQSGVKAVVKAGPVKPVGPKTPVPVGSWKKRG